MSDLSIEVAEQLKALTRLEEQIEDQLNASWRGKRMICTTFSDGSEPVEIIGFRKMPSTFEVSVQSDDGCKFMCYPWDLQPIQ